MTAVELVRRGAVISSAVALLLPGLAGTAVGKSTTAPQKLTLRSIRLLGPTVWNYDLEVDKPQQLLRKNPTSKAANDPIMIVFTRNATRKNVESLLRSIGLRSGPRKGEEYRSAVGYTTVQGVRRVLQSKGLKTDPCYRPFIARGTPFDFHVRFYGDISTKKYGRVTLGAAHEDRNDCTSNPDQIGQSFGWNEDAEKYVTGRLKAKGCTVHPNSLNFRNRLDFWKPPHRYLSDGWASEVEVRGPTCRPARGRRT